MAIIVRGTKASAGGGTAFITGTTILPGEVNTDFDTVYSEVNGSLNSANLAAGADIAQTQVGDISATAAAHDDTTTPGDSSSHTLPTTGAGELQQLRYVVERLALGNAADRVDGSGTGTTFWGDLPVRGPNLIVNPNFAIRNSSVATPQGWTLVGSPSLANNALSGADLSEGRGIALTIAANNAAQEGISQTLRPRASTRYLVLARVKATSGDAHLETTGADVTSSFRNIDDTTSSTSYVTLKGVIQTDSTPTDIVVQVLTNGDSDTNDIKVSFVGVYECHADHAILCGSGSFELTSTSAVTLGSAAFADVFVGAAIEVRVPGPGFEIHAEAIVPLANTTAGAEAVAVRITENASPSDTSVWELEMPATSTATAVVSFVNTAPVAGTLYTYDVSGRSTVAASLTTNGTSLVTGTPTRTAILRVRVVRVSE